MYTHEGTELREPVAPIKPVILPEIQDYLLPAMKSYLKQRWLDVYVALHNGWYPTYDREGWARIVIPASSLINSWPYFQARLMQIAPSGVKRYVSPSAPRGDALAVVFPDKCILGSIIVEGPMDALAAAGLGYVGIGLMGNTPSNPVLDHIETITKVYGECYVIPDRDAFKEGADITAKLWVRGIRCTLKTIQGAKDLAELSPERRKILIS
ncbi:MAG: hypothetical protein ACRCZI_02960 [Cetobacterium sp.]